MAPLVGEFDIDPSTITEAPLPPAKQEIVLQIRTAERKVAPQSGNSYIALTLDPVDFPGAVVFQSYFLSAKALAARSSAISFKKFLEKVNLPFTTTVGDLPNFRFKAILKHKGLGDEAQAEVDSVVGAA